MPAFWSCYGYDNANRRTSITQGTSTWSYGYDAGNRVTSLTSGDSSVTYYSYDNANRETEIQHKTSGGTVLSDYQYGYDAVNTLYASDTDGTSTAEHTTGGYFCNKGRCLS